MSTVASNSQSPEIGILMLETRFPRILGDVGNAKTWPFPVRYKVVGGADVRSVVCTKAQGLLEAFIEAGHELVEDGVSGITTGCGFLSIMQNELAAALPVPVATSSLMQASVIDKMLPSDRCIGILTISEKDLSEEHLSNAGVPYGVPIVGTDPDGEFSTKILNDHIDLDVDKASHDLLDAAERLVFQNEDVGAIILECTNMAPYAYDIKVATGLPVYSIYSFVSWFHASLFPPEFTQ